MEKHSSKGGITVTKIPETNEGITETSADQVLELLCKSAVDELGAYYQYSILSSTISGCEACNIKEYVESARYKDRKHFEALVERIYQLGGSLPSHIKVWEEGLDPSPGLPAALSKDMQDIQEMFLGLRKAELLSIRNFTRLCNLTSGLDRETYILVLEILNEKLDQRSWFSSFINNGPTGSNSGSGHPFDLDPDH